MCKEPSDSDDIPLCKILCQRCGTTGGIKQIGTHNRSEICRGARVALCVHPTHTDTDHN
jgi:hypothetical protein